MFNPLTEEPTPSKLPPELWYECFEWATFIPGVFDVTVPDPFDTSLLPDGDAHHFPSIIYAHQQIELQRSLQVKRTLVLVCKDWHTIAVPLLYRTLFIRQTDDLPTIRDTLLDSRRRLASAGFGIEHSLGACTRRVDIWLPSLCDNDGAMKILLEPLTSIFSCLPSLRSLFVLACAGRAIRVMPDSVINAIADSCAGTLERICWDSESTVLPMRETYRNLLRRSRRMRTIDSALYAWAASCPLSMAGPRAERGILEKLDYFTMEPWFHCDYEPILEHGSLASIEPPYPNLRKIILRASSTLGHHHCLHHSIAIQGRTITTVYLELVNPPALPLALDLLSTHCPSLRHLIIMFPRALDTLPPFTVPSTVSHFGIYVDQSTKAVDFAKLFDRLAHAIGTPDAAVEVEVPSPSSELMVVRFLNSEVLSMTRLRKWFGDIWCQGLKKFSTRGWIVQDWKGDELCVAGFSANAD